MYVPEGFSLGAIQYIQSLANPVPFVGILVKKGLDRRFYACLVGKQSVSLTDM